jgi:hypothetical protein
MNTDSHGLKIWLCRNSTEPSPVEVRANSAVG